MTAPCVGRADLYDAAMHDAAAYEYAAALCATCPGRDACLADGRDNHLSGVYGGQRLKGGRATTKAVFMAESGEAQSPICEAEGCAGASHAKGWCEAHYQRWRRYGDPTHVPGGTCRDCGQARIASNNRSGRCKRCRRRAYDAARRAARRQRTTTTTEGDTTP